MAKRISVEVRVVRAIGEQYRAVDAKVRILDEFVAVTGYHCGYSATRRRASGAGLIGRQRALGTLKHSLELVICDASRPAFRSGGQTAQEPTSSGGDR